MKQHICLVCPIEYVEYVVVFLVCVSDKAHGLRKSGPEDWYYCFQSVLEMYYPT